MTEQQRLMHTAKISLKSALALLEDNEAGDLDERSIANAGNQAMEAAKELYHLSGLIRGTTRK